MKELLFIQSSLKLKLKYGIATTWNERKRWCEGILLKNCCGKCDEDWKG